MMFLFSLSFSALSRFVPPTEQAIGSRSDFLLVSLFPAQRFPASDTAGLLILIIDRGIIKVAPARGRFQLRISVPPGTIGLVRRRERAKEKERQRERERQKRKRERDTLEKASFLPVLFLVRSSFFFCIYIYIARRDKTMLGQHARIFLINFTETDRCSFACGKTLPRSDVVIFKGTSLGRV